MTRRAVGTGDRDARLACRNGRENCRRSESVQPTAEKCQARAAACERLSRLVRDPQARRAYERAARNWRFFADAEDRLARLVKLLAPAPYVED
jgi:hypothetical protein